MAMLATKDSRYADLLHEPDLCSRLKVAAAYDILNRQEEETVRELLLQQELAIPPDIDYYSSDVSLSNEMKQRLHEARPATLGEASRVAGVTPSAVLSLFRYCQKLNTNGSTSHPVVAQSSS
ncbi:GidA associated domain 3 [Trinorchestia longiramus]|nr:GidA associated domain 3 [Trinorchestia longiramus]